MKKSWLAVLTVWIILIMTDFLLHGIYMASLYQKTASLWRPLEELQKMMPVMWIGQLIFSATFVWVFSKGIEKGPWLSQSVRFGLAMLLLCKLPEQLIMYANSPYPFELLANWIFISFIQLMLCSLALGWIYKKFSKAH